MLMEIKHVTRYRYARPVRESVMELWMQPQKSAVQRLLSFDLEVDPPSQLFSYGDSFGNAVYYFDVPQPHDTLEIIARSAVETEPPERLPEALDRGEWDRLRSEFVQGEWYDFLRLHGYAVRTEALERFVEARALNDLRRLDPLTAARELSHAIYEAFDYQPGVTGADSPIDHAIEEGRGVCQDFAHIMIAICRGWGIPARYVSGYLYRERGETHDRSDADASHAWVEVFLPSVRWVGFDPTNDIPAGERHICVAIGRDYADVPPSRGVFKGESESELAVGVSVRRARNPVTEAEFLKLSRPAFSAAPRRRPSLIAEQLRQHQQHQQ